MGGSGKGAGGGSGAGWFKGGSIWNVLCHKWSFVS